MMDSKYDLGPDQTPYPYSWFSCDIKLGCLTIHLDEDNWHKCVVSEILTNVELMLSTHIMDQGSKITCDIEEKEINLGQRLIQKTFGGLLEDLQVSELEAVRELLGHNFQDFKHLYEYHFERIRRELARIEASDT